jgi:CoA:oxalate CoA-transferase
MAKPLEGVIVLDLARVLAGPFCCMLLEDLGARIIKIERPGGGDDSREFGPFINGQSLYFLNINRGKKSLALDLKNPAGAEVLKELVKKADVLVENFRPGTMEKLGLGWEVLHQINPRLVYGAISGFGTTGPDALKPSYDILVQAQSGLMSITGLPEQDPVRAGYSVGDINGALFCTIGILAALHQRASSGLGQKVDVGMLDCQVAVLENALSRFQVDKKSPGPLGHRHPTITPFQGFKAQDGWFVIAAGNDGLFKKLAAVLGAEELLSDSRFKSNGERTVHQAALTEKLQAIFITNTAAHWLSLVNSAGVPCAPVNTIEGVMQDPQLKARNMLVPCPDALAGEIIVAGNPIKMENIPEESRRAPAPGVGEHRDEILSAYLNKTPQEIGALEKTGAFGQGEPE